MRKQKNMETILGISNFVLLTMHPFDRIVCFFRSSTPPKTYCTHYTRETTNQAKKKVLNYNTVLRKNINIFFLLWLSSLWYRHIINRSDLRSLSWSMNHLSTSPFFCSSIRAKTSQWKQRTKFPWKPFTLSFSRHTALHRTFSSFVLLPTQSQSVILDWGKKIQGSSYF